MGKTFSNGFVGYEYVVVGYCSRTKRPVMSPRVWGMTSGKPVYHTCLCHGRARDGK